MRRTRFFYCATNTVLRSKPHTCARAKVSAGAIGQMCEQPALPQDLNFSSWVQAIAPPVWYRGGPETEDKWRPALKQDARRGGGEIRWEKRRFVYPWWSVDVGGLCSRHIQISLFKIFWYLALGTGLEREHVWECATGHCLISFTDSGASVFSTLSAASSRREQSARGRRAGGAVVGDGGGTSIQHWLQHN